MFACTMVENECTTVCVDIKWRRKNSEQKHNALLTVASHRPWLISHVNEFIYLLCPKIGWSVSPLQHSKESILRYLWVYTTIHMSANNKETKETDWYNVSKLRVQPKYIHSVNHFYISYARSICGCLFAYPLTHTCTHTLTLYKYFRFAWQNWCQQTVILSSPLN